jgi:hypothetical protein
MDNSLVAISVTERYYKKQELLLLP